MNTKLLKKHKQLQRKHNTHNNIQLIQNIDKYQQLAMGTIHWATCGGVTIADYCPDCDATEAAAMGP